MGVALCHPHNQKIKMTEKKPVEMRHFIIDWIGANLPNLNPYNAKEMDAAYKEAEKAYYDATKQEKEKDRSEKVLTDTSLQSQKPKG